MEGIGEEGKQKRKSRRRSSFVEGGQTFLLRGEKKEKKKTESWAEDPSSESTDCLRLTGEPFFFFVSSLDPSVFFTSVLTIVFFFSFPFVKNRSPAPC